tara:strand:+ start:1039 stop:2073 length:1035 start_codon:yes stop_codon:yes gene_type:complete
MTEYIHFLPSLTIGGAPINVLRAIKWMNTQRPENIHTIYTPLDNDAFEKEFIEAGANVKSMPNLRINLNLILFFILLFFKIKINKRQESVIILHGRGCGLILKPLAIIFRLQTVHFFRGFTPTYGLKNSKYLRFLIIYDCFLAHFGTCVAVGADEYNQIFKVLNPKKLMIVRNPVPKIFWELCDDAFDFGFVGRRSYQKGFDLALKICAENPTKRFVWVGDEVGGQYQSENIPQNLTLMKYRSQHEIFSIIKTIICLSRWEGCSTIITECVNSKKPFISLHCNGVSEFSITNINDSNFHDCTSTLSGSLKNIDHFKLSYYANHLYEKFASELSIDVNMKKWLEF